MEKFAPANKCQPHGNMFHKIYKLKEATFNGSEEMQKRYVKGTKVKVVMISRFGDVGISDDLRNSKLFGYDWRVEPDMLEFVRDPKCKCADCTWTEDKEI